MPCYRPGRIDHKQHKQNVPFIDSVNRCILFFFATSTACYSANDVIFINNKFSKRGTYKRCTGHCCAAAWSLSMFLFFPHLYYVRRILFFLMFMPVATACCRIRSVNELSTKLPARLRIFTYVLSTSFFLFILQGSWAVSTAMSMCLCLCQQPMSG